MAANSSFESLLRKTPGIRQLARWIRRRSLARSFTTSTAYWEQRYHVGDTSGDGSYGRLAEFKAEFLNAFVERNGITSVLEFGCGDGAQLQLARYPEYTGFDVSPTVIRACIRRFADDQSKSFYSYHPFAFADRAGRFQADLVLSLDVLYHLVEDDVFQATMRHMFASAKRFVIVYSADRDEMTPFRHVRLRRFTPWVSENLPDWELTEHTPNRYPFDPKRPQDTSISDFYVFRRRG